MKKDRRFALSVAIVTLIVFAGFPLSAPGEKRDFSSLGSDEKIHWFPALATPQRDHWEVTFSGLVTEDETRPATSWLARKLLGFSDEELGSEERAIFRERTRRFMADDEPASASR